MRNSNGLFVCFAESACLEMTQIIYFQVTVKHNSIQLLASTGLKLITQPQNQLKNLKLDREFHIVQVRRARIVTLFIAWLEM